MATQLSTNFTLEEMPCYQQASAEDVNALERTVRRVLQPVRDHFGKPVIVTSWRWWADQGCKPRTGAHAGGGTVDFVVPGVDLKDVFMWGLSQKSAWDDYVGRWIYEPTGPGQGEHIHVAPIADMVAAFGATFADSAAYVLTAPNSYTPVPGWSGSATDTNSLNVEGVDVTVGGSGKLDAWALGGVTLLVLALFVPHTKR